MAEMDPHYQPKAAEPKKACRNCKHFEINSGNEEIGNCFGHEVAAEGMIFFASSRIYFGIGS